MAVLTWANIVLLAIIVLQWVLLTLVLTRSPSWKVMETNLVGTTSTTIPLSPPTVGQQSTTTTSSMSFRNLLHERERRYIARSDEVLDGVAATLIYRAPKWFHLRYKVMLDNALANLPSSKWKVQVILNVDWAESELLPWHPGLQKLFTNDDRVIVTPLPANMTRNVKPKQITASPWFWNSMASDRVLLFSGNGAFCGNHNGSAWDDLLHYDFVGVPNIRMGSGGDGSSHSLRTRRAMRVAQEYGADVTSSRSVVQALEKYNKENQAQGQGFRIADTAATEQFGGVYNLSSSEQGLIRLPLVVAGTQARLTYGERDSLLKHCPELKLIFPSLHEPACFGAHPQPDTCRSSICALQENVPSHGC